MSPPSTVEPVEVGVLEAGAGRNLPSERVRAHTLRLQQFHRHHPVLTTHLAEVDMREAAFAEVAEHLCDVRQKLHSAQHRIQLVVLLWHQNRCFFLPLRLHVSREVRLM
eukprot:CAMPEP_0177442948 /NCGR_PEP_ID=MMETSP0369-20130122/5210_1 /TAXON_ID=447022 ORGANISM="Scrippsiella hangoei-like, Strain SHHI-4" /NCGR_SAMPLE_ID=MMETSP0369 /ASSEMBLY_ACC=CAM_ASM_000364 /LENGTH=108 /DNA_ID=CAMNT_0018914915 /DNA_START=628 /DNA_END=954 /DNA_ORIENTATION=+